ncbi:MAG TPA: hypothetical protein VFS90_11910 [Pyrinomonadaceae bacterium]|nr:hypothetical protein [Pyrinomonadaceae bacterium]
MKPLRALWLLILAISAALVGCSANSELKQNSDDVVAMNKIYESSPWIVKNSKLDLKAREGGAVEVSLEAIATRRSEARGPIWLPLAMVSELPDYFEGTDLTTSKQIELEAYRVPDGLWVITGVLPEPANPIVSSTPVPGPAATTPTTSPEPGQPAVQTNQQLSQVTTDIKVRITMVSEKFVSGFPILIPPGEGKGAVAATVTLPDKANFLTLDVTNGDRSIQSTMTALPVSMTGNEQKAAIRLIPESGKVWNFANVTYTLNTSGTWRRWFFPSAVMILLLGATLWWQFERVDDYRKSLSTIRRAKDESLRQLRKSKHELMATIPSLTGEGEEAGRQLRHILSRGIDLLPDDGWFDEIGMYEWHKKVTKPLFSLLNLERSQELALRLQIDRITLQLESLEKLNTSIRHSYEDWGRVRRVLWGICFLLMLSMIWLLSAVARAQPHSQPNASKPAVARLATLGELNVEIVPQIPTSDNYDKVNVNLSFFPLSEIADQRASEEIGIGVSDYANLSIDPVQLPPNSPATVIQETGKLLRLSVPVSVAPVLQRWKILADWKPVEFSANPEYLNSLEQASKVNLTYTIKGAQVIRERAGGRFFHWFPFETAEVQFPIDLRQPAILSKINLQPPTSEYVANPVLEGLANQFVMSENGRSYQASSKDQQGRAAIWANKPVVLKASFQRPWWQRYGLLVGQLIIGAFAAVLTGWLAFKKETNPKSKIIAGFGIVALPLAIRIAAMAKYENLPTILLFQGITLFEIFFLANIVLMLIISLVSFKRFGGTW